MSSWSSGERARKNGAGKQETGGAWQRRCVTGGQSQATKDRRRGEALLGSRFAGPAQELPLPSGLRHAARCCRKHLVHAL